MRFSREILTVLLPLVFAASAHADDCGCDGRVPYRLQEFSISSGEVQHSGSGSGPEIVFSKVITQKDAQWLRLGFEGVQLAGDPGSDNASFLRIISTADLATQILNAETLRQWNDTTAYFNGNTVIVQLISYKGTGPSRITISDAHVGQSPAGAESICGTDNRTLSSDPRAARHLPEGCTAWLHDDLNKTFMSAGHCGVSQGDVIQFNVPLSNANGSLNHPGPEDQYPVEPTSIQSQNGGVGNDWCYFATFTNSNTGMSAFQKQGAFYIKAPAAPAVAGQQIRITGYGTVSSPISPTWQQVQKTHAGPYFSMSGTTIRYQTDTTGGNSGSAVQDESTGRAIGVHTHGGCTSTGGSNQGTGIHQTNLQNALNNPRGLCRSGSAPVAPPIFVIGDLNNNFGTVNASTGGFGKVSEFSSTMQGLAYDGNLGMFYACDSANRLYTVQPSSGAASQIGTISGAGGTVNGLAFDPNAGVLYGIVQSTGQLLRISTATFAATPIGSANGGIVGALDYDANRKALFGLDDANGATRLIRIDVATGARTVVGSLGTGISDCNGLAANERDGFLYTVNAANQTAFRIHPDTGAATSIGLTNGLFGASFGMAAEGFRRSHLLAESIQMGIGAVSSGNLSDLSTSDNSYLQLVTGPRLNRNEPLVRATFTTTAPSNQLQRLKLTLESAAPNWVQEIELFNFVTGQWEPLDNSQVGSTDLTRTVEVTASPSRFVHGSTREVRVRLNWRGSGTIARGDVVKLDQLVWTVSH